jgi:hypothetical protein
MLDEKRVHSQNSSEDFANWYTRTTTRADTGAADAPVSRLSRCYAVAVAGRSTRGRTSTVPAVTDGMRAAMAIASSRFLASIR